MKERNKQTKSLNIKRGVTGNHFQNVNCKMIVFVFITNQANNKRQISIAQFFFNDDNELEPCIVCTYICT